jgi:hypothetical protein
MPVEKVTEEEFVELQRLYNRDMKAFGTEHAEWVGSHEEDVTLPSDEQ